MLAYYLIPPLTLVPGFAIALCFHRAIRFNMNRGQYIFWSFAFLGLDRVVAALVPSSFGQTSVGIVAVFGYALIFGGYFGVISIARANNINGNLRLAVLGIIPIASLYLFFAPPKKKTIEKYRRIRQLWSFTLATGYVCAGLMILAVDLFVEKRQERRQFIAVKATQSTQYYSGTAQATHTRTVSTEQYTPSTPATQQPDADMLSRVAKIENGFRQLDQFTTLQHSYAERQTLNYIYKLSLNFTELPEYQYLNILEETCQRKVVKLVTSGGVTINYIYVTAENGYIDTIVVSDAMCAPFGA